MRPSALFSAALLLLESAVATNNVVVESLHAVPDGWTKLRKADPTQYIRLRIALEQPNLAKFEQKFYDISTPQHSLYGQHLSREELRDFMKPRDESIDTVIAWLRASGIPRSDIENDGEWVNFFTTVGNAERLLDTDFGIYSHAATQVEQLRTLQYITPIRYCNTMCSL
jgi:tripeptidyl-peptidase-1